MFPNLKFATDIPAGNPKVWGEVEEQKVDEMQQVVKAGI